MFIYMVWLRNDPALKMRLLCNDWKFLHQILYTCSAGVSPLMCCFWLKLCYVYEMHNTKPLVRILQLHIVMLHSEQLLPNLLKKVKVELLRKIDMLTYSCTWAVTVSAKKL